MKQLSSVLLLTTIWTTITVSSGQELLLKPLSEAHYKALDAALLLTCEVTDAVDEVDYLIKWIGSDGREITEKTGRRYIEEDSKSLKKLYLTKIASSDAGLYSCNATIGGQQIQKTTRLQIFRDITFGNISTEQFLKINSDALVRCDVTGEPKPEVSWRFSGKRLSFGGTDSRYTRTQEGLQIQNVTMQDNGEYTCRAEVDADGRYDERKINVEVHIPPKIIEGPGKVDGVEGRQASLKCVISSDSLPKPTFEFFKDDSNTPLQTSDSIKVDADGGSVEFASLKKTDKGKYTCTATNDVGTDSATGTLKVLVNPLIYELNNATENEGNTVELTCKSHGDPLPTMTFSREGGDPYPIGDFSDGKYMVSDDIDGQLTLTIKNLSPEDTGKYICRSNSSLGSHEMAANVVVQYKPQFSPDHPRLFHGWAASSHNLTCRASGQPSPRVDWFLRDEIVPNNDSFHVYQSGSTSYLSIKIRPIDQAWIYGKYECRATNDVGQTTLPIDLRRATIPGQPASANVIKRLPTMLVLNVDAPEEDGGVPITGYRVELKDKLVIEFAIGSKVALENLEPNTSYSMVVRAKNDVGAGPGINITEMTEQIREPAEVIISSPTQGELAHRYRVEWQHPDTGGSPITDYEFKFRPVRMTVINGTNKMELLNVDWNIINRQDNVKKPMLHFDLEELKENTSYEVEIRSRNLIGWSAINERFIFTTSQVKTEEKTSISAVASPIGVGLVLGITVVVLIVILVIVDLSCYFVNGCGLTSLICLKVFGRSTTLSKEKAAEEGESKEALTEKQSLVKEPLDNDQNADSVVVEKAGDVTADDHDEKPLLVDGSDDVKKDVPTEVNTQDDLDDEPVKQKIEDDEVTATDDTKEEVIEKQEESGDAADAEKEGEEKTTTQPGGED